MGISERLARIIYWNILIAMRRPRGRLLRSLKHTPEPKRTQRLESFRKNERFARRIGRPLLKTVISTFFLVISGATLYIALLHAQANGWFIIPENIRQSQP